MSPKTNTYHIYYDKDLDCVVIEFDGYATSRQFREGMEKMLELLERHNTTRVLADVKDMVLIGSDDQKWLQNDFLPRAALLGFNSMGIIKPDSYFNKIAVERIAHNIDHKKISIHVADSLMDAKNWLLTKEANRDTTPPQVSQ